MTEKIYYLMEIIDLSSILFNKVLLYLYIICLSYSEDMVVERKLITTFIKTKSNWLKKAQRVQNKTTTT